MTPEEARGQEEAHRVVAVPPLRHRVLHAAEQADAVALVPGQRHRQVVDHVQHGDGDDEGQVVPVGDVDVRLPPLQQRADEEAEIGEPDDRQPEVGQPFRLGVFAALRDAHDVAEGGEHDEELVAPEDELGGEAPGQPRAAGALHAVEAGADHRIAAEGEDDAAGVHRAQPAEGAPGFARSAPARPSGRR